MNAWQAWIGREEQRTDRLDPALCARWLATLDRPAPAQPHMPQGIHWCLCTPDAATGLLGPDGHPLRDESPASFLPPVPQPRRMWASSALQFVQPLTIGEAVTRISRVQSVTEKQGGSGTLVFVDIGHETHGEQGLAVREVQTLVYRDPPEPGSPPSPPPLGETRFDPASWDAVRTLCPDEVLLFRFSALTFNSHRIHYDARYAIAEENYRGLVVHGPLTATLLVDLAQRRSGENALRGFTFRGISPAVAGEVLHLAVRECSYGLELGAFATDGREVMRASARV